MPVNTGQSNKKTASMEGVIMADSVKKSDKESSNKLESKTGKALSGNPKRLNYRKRNWVLGMMDRKPLVEGGFIRTNSETKASEVVCGACALKKMKEHITHRYHVQMDKCILDGYICDCGNQITVIHGTRPKELVKVGTVKVEKSKEDK